MMSDNESKITEGGSLETKLSPDDDSSKKTKSYVFTDYQVELAKLRAQGLSLSQIANRVGKPEARNNISRALNAFNETARRMRKVMRELSEVGYWEKQVDRNVPLKLGRDTIKQMLQDGFWPFNPRLLPPGYMVGEMRRIKKDPVYAEKMKRVYERVANGDPPYKAAREEGLRPGSAQHINRLLTNPIYKGYNRYGRETIPGKHEAIIDEETWNKVQTILNEAKKLPVFNPKVGFRRVGASIIVDEETVKKLREACTLRFKDRKTTKEIAEKTGLTYGVVYALFHEDDYKRLVGDDLWEKAHAVKITRKELSGRRRERDETKMLQFFLSQPEFKGSPPKISKEANIGLKPTIITLKRLKEKGILDKEPKRRGKWFLLKASP